MRVACRDCFCFLVQRVSPILKTSQIGEVNSFHFHYDLMLLLLSHESFSLSNVSKSAFLYLKH